MLKKCSLVLIGLVVGVLLSEIGARLVAPEDFERSFKAYLAPDESSVEKRGVEANIEDVTRVQTRLSEQPKAAHPYFGYTVNRASGRGVNREGFLGPEIERSPDSKQYVIGIFGGSLAEHFALHQLEKQSQGKAGIVDKVRGCQRVGGREIKILNFALSAFKQPQQYIVASLYLDSIDMAVNIDGFNELSQNQPREFGLIFPAYSHLLFPVEAHRQAYWRELFVLRERQIAVTQWLYEREWMRSLAFVHVAWKAYLKYLDGKILAAYEIRKQSQDRVFYYPEELTLDERIAEKVKLWMKFTRRQSSLLRAHGIPAFFFVQPNQYFADSKPFSDEEREKFIKPDKYTPDVVHGYPQLVRAASDMSREGIPVFDLTRAFYGHTETLYRDRCCHINESGMEILEEAIVTRILANCRAASVARGPRDAS